MEKEVGGVLKEARIKAGISVKQISTFLTKKGYKASEKTIYSWEIGYSQPTPGALFVMCEIYGIHDILTAFGYDGYKKDGGIELNIKEIQLIEIYRSLDDLGKKNVGLVLELENERIESISEKEKTIHDLYTYIEKLENEKRSESSNYLKEHTESHKLLTAGKLTDIEVTEETKNHHKDLAKS